GGIAGFIISRKVFQKQLKKNPPINEKMIRALYMQMGRKPSEAQVRAAMKAMNQYK
ncbi:MAG: YneF family protein, partial [Bacilli bacterium]|nr:YneF family protein [Bacilli bacterium]